MKVTELIQFLEFRPHDTGQVVIVGDGWIKLGVLSATFAANGDLLITPEDPDIK